jgi:hypothetical protein
VVLLVGHSYNDRLSPRLARPTHLGPVISDFAPEEGQNLTDPQAKFPSPEIIAYIVEHQLPEGGNGFTLAAEGFHESFGADLLADDAAF